MVGRPAAAALITSSLTSLVPRQVMLESCSHGAGAVLAEKKAEKRRKGEQEERRSLPAARAALLHAIAAFLEGSGFSRTLAVLRSEAQLEIDDGSNSSVLDLEGIICKYLESSKDLVVGNYDGPEEQDGQSKALKKKEGIHDHTEEPVSKKKKKKIKGGDDNVKTEFDKYACENGAAQLNLDKLLKGKDQETDNETAEKRLIGCNMEPKDQKRKKSKKVSDEAVESLGDDNDSSLLDESNSTSKDKKKKKKHNLTSDFFCGVANEVGLATSEEEKGKSKESERKTDGQMRTLASENVTLENPMGKDTSKSKDKKKRKHKLIVEGSGVDFAELQNGGEKKEKIGTHDNAEDTKESEPRKEAISSSAITGNIDKNAKKRKRTASEDVELNVDNGTAVQASKQKKPEGLKGQKAKEETPNLDDSLLKSELHAPGKRKKKEKAEDNSEKPANAPANNQSQVPKDAKETPVTGNGHTKLEGQQQTTGDIRNSEPEGNGSQKSSKAELKRFTEPKTVNAFQRVKIDEVKFADERLQDNSYWAKDGADSGYGAKAQEVLGQVRGRDFRHEKTKKKRGSYRGGQIGFESHSVKFKYSDDEEE